MAIVRTKRKLRNRIIVAFMIAILPAILLMSAIIELVIAPHARQQLCDELTQTTDLVVNSIQASASIAVRERLQYLAEKNRDYAQLLMDEVDDGLRTREEAINLIKKHFHEQKIGKTGYIYCLTSDRILPVHPFKELEGTYASEDTLAQRQFKIHEGYFEYEWQNPGDPFPRAKALSQVYFKPLDWYISVTCYRSEYASLIDPEDFRPSIANLNFGKNGYTYIFSINGDAVIHPKLTSDIAKLNEHNTDFVSKMINNSDGIIEYEWIENPDKKPREKIGVYRHLRDIDWIVASSAYKDEIFYPLQRLRMVIYGSDIFLILVAGTLAFFLSKRITRPLEQMVSQLEKNSQEGVSEPLQISDNDEIGKLAGDFNHYLQILEQRDKTLHEQRQMLQNITENSPGIFYQFKVPENSDPVLLYVSGQLDGIQRPEPGEPDFIQQLTSHFPADDQKVFGESLHTSIQNRSRWHFEGRFLKSDGTLVWLSTAASVQVHEDGLYFNGYLMDITERKHLEEQVHHIQKMDAIGQLAGGIAHDFNNMLGGIMGVAEVIQLQAPDNTAVMNSADLILNVATRAAELTTKLLAFSRKEKLDNTFVDIGHVITEAISLLKHTLDKKIELFVDQQAQQTTVLGDPSQLQNVFLNLGINSGYAMPDGGRLSFTIRRIDLDEQYCASSRFVLVAGTYVQIEVRDTGCGIAPENLDHVFEPFFTTRQSGKGTGLGLAAVYGTIQQHHGAITVYSELNRGTVFHILLPEVHSDSHKESNTPIPISGTGTILVVDDEEVLRLTAEGLLTHLGYHVLLASNGQEGIDLYKQRSSEIDLVLLDMVMPQISGRECFKLMREINPDAKIILVSGFSQEDDVIQLKKDGLAGFLRKPYRKWDLSNIIADVLGSAKDNPSA